MFKRITSVILLLAVLAFNFSKLILWGYYELNKAQITELYCVNKDKPSMHCCGKCMLKKKLAQDDARKNSPAIPDSKYEITLFNAASCTHLIHTDNITPFIYSPYCKVYLQGAHISIFHPPCA